MRFYFNGHIGKCIEKARFVLPPASADRTCEQCLLCRMSWEGDDMRWKA
jgi:hypothetical protein